MAKVIARINTSTGRVVVQDGETYTEYGTVVMKDVEWGFGACRGELVETSEQVVPTSRIKGRAFFNPGKVPRYVDKTTGKILSESKYAYLYGRSALYGN